MTAGFPEKDSTVPLMLALEAGGADVIELGVPFSDPIADGPVIQQANTVSTGHKYTNTKQDGFVIGTDCCYRLLSRTMFIIRTVSNT